MAVTLQQVADACGVSRGTVDRALHGKEGVRPEVARRVREAARELGYIPRRAGTAELRRARIGVVLHTGSSAFVQQRVRQRHQHQAVQLLVMDQVVNQRQLMMHIGIVHHTQQHVNRQHGLFRETPQALCKLLHKGGRTGMYRKMGIAQTACTRQ